MARGAKTKKGKTLTEELAALLDKAFLPDLQERAQQPRIAASLRKRHDAEKAKHRTASTFEEWVEHTVEQVGAAWILSCVFVRTLEDRGLVDRRRLAGPGALDSQQQFFEIAPSLTERDYVLTVFRELAAFPGAADVLGPAHNPAWRLSPSNDSVRALLALLREEDGGTLRFGFGGTDTHFLGNLYQDLSESVRERYALLQTPVFVERFILNQTLEPAIAEFGLETVRIIDPTCGSGHFLLGAFHRLCDHRMRVQPGVDPRDHATRALAQVYGVDLNPYAVAIARFRLMLAYLEEAGIDKLARAPRIETNLVVADSLLHGGSQRRLGEAVEEEHKAAWGDEMFVFEDPPAARRIFGQRYHAVVGNPPYITCKDAALRERYRERYESASGKYALAAPFTERFFELAEDGGFVGLINANSFMKREFGKALIEKVLPRVDLTCVVDTSGAYIPGHGTPTVLLFGRNRKSAAEKVRAVMGKRGEPTTPDDPEKGHVWSSIAAHHTEVGFDDDYISVAEVARDTLNKHSWSLGGGGAAELKELLEDRRERRLGDIATAIGFDAIMGEDELFTGSSDWMRRLGVDQEYVREFAEGEDIRDWAFAGSGCVIFPYDDQLNPKLPNGKSTLIGDHFWRYRTNLIERRQFGKNTIEAKLEWFEYRSFYKSKRSVPLSIAYAEVATHNHFVLDRGGKVFKQTAPIIKLPSAATEDDHLALLAYLNSSTACFWMKQVCFNKGNRGEGGGTTAEEWEKFYQYSGTKLEQMPVPRASGRLRELGRLLGHAGSAWAQLQPSSVLATCDVTGIHSSLEDARKRLEILEAQIRWLQEELDWAVYEEFGLVRDASVNVPKDLETTPQLARGERPSDVLFARSVRDGTAGERYFILCHLPPVVYVANQTLQDRAQARLRLIEGSSELRLIEGPSYKRTFREGHRPWNDLPAIRAATLDAVERLLIKDRQPVSLRQLEERVQHDQRASLLLTLLGTSTALVELISNSSIAFLAGLRLTEEGLRRYREWQGVWSRQREDHLAKIDPPNHYAATDYVGRGWQLRGKLDVPRERFISYPGCERDDDRSPLIGWAGWNHLERAQALAALFQERKEQDGWERDRLTPILAGILELVPWLKQWHNEPDPAYGERMGDAYEGFVSEKARELGLTLEQLREWRPDPKKGARAAKARRKEDGAAATAGEESASPADHETPDEDAAPAPKRRRGRSKKATA